MTLFDLEVEIPPPKTEPPSADGAKTDAPPTNDSEPPSAPPTVSNGAASALASNGAAPIDGRDQWSRAFAGRDQRGRVFYGGRRPHPRHVRRGFRRDQRPLLSPARLSRPQLVTNHDRITQYRYP